AAAAWLASLYYILTATSLPAAQIGIREASSAGILIIAMLNLLRLSIGRANSDWRSILGQSRVWLIVTAAIIVLCQTKFFLQGVRILRVGSQPTPVPIYGPGVYIYVSYFVCVARHIFARALCAGVVASGNCAAFFRSKCAYSRTCSRRGCDRLCHGSCPRYLPATGGAAFHRFTSTRFSRNC